MNLLKAERDLRWMQWQRWEAKLKLPGLDEVQREMYRMNAQQAAAAYMRAAQAAQDAAAQRAAQQGAGYVR